MIMEVLMTTIWEIVQKVGSLLKFIFQLNAPCVLRYFENEKVSGDEFGRKLFECPGCLDIPLPPIYTCSSGHIVCEPCRKVLQSCPQCQGDYNGQARNFVVETIIGTKRFNCRYSEDGCSQVLSGNELNQHENNCQFRHVHCNIVDTAVCDGSWRGSIEKYYSHLVVAHEVEFYFKNKNVTFKAQIEPITNKFIGFLHPTVGLKVVQGKNFIVQPFYDEVSKNVFIFTTGVYRNESSQDSTTTTIVSAQVAIKLLNNDPKGSSQTNYVWQGSVNSVYENLEEIFEKENGLIIPYDDLIKRGKISSSIVTWDFQVDFTPPAVIEIPRHPSTSFISRLTNMNNSLPKFFRFVFSSSWSLMAPAFTILFILFFVIFV